jgi:hypothetical protein
MYSEGKHSCSPATREIVLLTSLHYCVVKCSGTDVPTLFCRRILWYVYMDVKIKMFRLSARALFVFVFCTECQNLSVASQSARVLAEMRAKVVPHMARGLGGADAFQFALREMGNNKDEEEESHDDDEKSFSVSMYHTWYRRSHHGGILFV